MILITGTQLSVSDLPNSEMMDYQIDNERMNIKLKTVAKSPSCFQIYIAEDKRLDYTITEELATKIVYFTDDDDLLAKLSNGDSSQEKDIFEDTPSEPAPIEVPNFSEMKKEDVEESHIEESEVEKKISKKKEEKTSKENKIVVDLKKSDEDNTEDKSKKESSVFQALDLEEANTDLPEDMLQIPNLSEDVDSLKEVLATKDKIIAQKDGMIKELKNTIDDSYKVQEEQLIEVETMWTEKVNELQALISELREQNSMANLDSSMVNFLKYINYAQQSKAVEKEGFSDAEQLEIGKLNSIFTVFACGSGESYYSMAKQVKKYIEYSPNCIILDFTNDIYLSSLLRLNPKNCNTMELLKDEVNPSTLIQDINGTKYIPTISFNDIALLNVDWAKMLRKIDDFASGVPVVMLFGNINNFNVRYTVSKLASIVKLNIFVKCSPIILTALYRDVAFIPKQRVSIVAIDYIDVVKSILAEIAKQYNVTAFSGDVEWKKLNML